MFNLEMCKSSFMQFPYFSPLPYPYPWGTSELTIPDKGEGGGAKMPALHISSRIIMVSKANGNSK